MKIRKGFVSNSSSSSFVCWGISTKNIKLSDKIWLYSFQTDKLFFEESLMKYNSENKDSWYLRLIEDAKNWINKANELNSDNEKIEFIKSYYTFDPYSLLVDKELFPDNFEVEGNPEYDVFYLGLPVSKIEKLYPDLKISEIRNFVANQLKNYYDQDITSADIDFINEYWYNG